MAANHPVHDEEANHVVGGAASRHGGEVENHHAGGVESLAPRVVVAHPVHEEAGPLFRENVHLEHGKAGIHDDGEG